MSNIYREALDVQNASNLRATARLLVKAADLAADAGGTKARVLRPIGEQKMTEDEIERWCERRMDALDARLMANQLTQEQYDAEVKVLNAHVERKYAFLPRY